LSKLNKKLFCAQAKKKFQVVSEENDLLNKEFKAVCLKYAEDADTYKWEEFFALLLQFNEQFEVKNRFFSVLNCVRKQRMII
jgi:hypothetical protein